MSHECIAPNELYESMVKAFKNNDSLKFQFEAGSGLNAGDSMNETIKWLEKNGIDPPKELLAAMESEVLFAAIIGSIARAYQLQSVIDSAQLDLGLGLSFKEWKTRMAKELFELPDYVMERIFRNNLQSSYQFGRAVHHRANVKTHPMLQYRAINDSRTREAHAAMHGFTAPHDDVIWKTAYAPNGYNCRCNVMAMTQERGDKEKKKYESKRKKEKLPLRPKSAADEGWGFSPLESKGPALESSVKSAIENTNEAFKSHLEKILNEITSK